ncbi:MAG: RNA polymerase sigma factor [Acidobacteriota bacterium]
MTGTPKVRPFLDRAALVAAAVEQNRAIWVRMAQRITADPQDAEDAVQEAISRVLTGAGRLPDVDAAGRYLTRSINHCAIDRVRARSRLSSFTEPGEPGPHLGGVEPDQETRLLLAEEREVAAGQTRRMLAELAKLPEAQRQAVELLILREPSLKLRELSELTGSPISTLHSRLRAALDSLREALSENEAPDR